MNQTKQEWGVTRRYLGQTELVWKLDDFDAAYIRWNLQRGNLDYSKPYTYTFGLLPH